MRLTPLFLIVSLCAPVLAQAQGAKPKATPMQKPAMAAMQKPAPSPEAEATYADIKATMGMVPTFLKRYPVQGIAGAWQEMKGIQMNPATALTGKEKELIGLAVASQIPCTYCVYFHTRAAKANGATDEEVAEAVAMAASSRHWSAIFHGYGFDMAAAKAMNQSMMDAAKKRMDAGGKPPPPMPVTDAQSAYADMQASMGVVPDFVKKFPPSGVAGAWKNVRDLEFSQDTTLAPKLKTLISVAVASQVPCDVCLALDEPAAMQAGATEAEVHEAVAMSALTRMWSTFLNGIGMDEATFRREVDQVFAHPPKADSAMR